ncbi:MAG: RNA 2',3'-cyclic phosphodiesterase [Gemmatimonadota bacterium]
MRGSARVFVAITLPDDVKAGLVRATAPIRDGGRALRWVPEPQLHLTLRFLGSIPRDAIERLESSLRVEAARCAAFDLRLRGGGCFPNPRNPRVLWVGVQPGPALGEAHAAVEDAVSAAGFDRTERPFRPHVTIGRVRRGRHVPTRVGEWLADSPIDATVRVWSVTLIESTLSTAGARHDPILTCPLSRI